MFLRSPLCCLLLTAWSVISCSNRQRSQVFERFKIASRSPSCCQDHCRFDRLHDSEAYFQFVTHGAKMKQYSLWVKSVALLPLHEVELNRRLRGDACGLTQLNFGALPEENRHGGRSCTSPAPPHELVQKACYNLRRSNRKTATVLKMLAQV
jgi:hypothetical protein